MGKNETPNASPWSLADRVLFTVLGLVAVFCLLQVLLMKFGRDQGIYAVVADTVLQGGMPYRDAWDFKPPGIFLIYTLAQGLFGFNEWAIRIVEGIALLSLFPVLGVLAQRFFGDLRIGLVGAVLAIWIHAQLEFWHTAQPESFGGILALAGLALSTHPMEFDGPRGKWKPWTLAFASGLLFGISGLMKPHLLAMPVIAALHAAWHLRTLGEPWKRQLKAFVAIGAGSVGAVGGCLAWFACNGALRDLYETLFLFAPGYAATTWNSRYFFHYIYLTGSTALVGYSAIMAVGILLTIGFDVRGKREREGLVLLAAMILPQLFGIAIQSKFFAYHFGATFPFLALIAAPGLWKFWQWVQRLPALGPALFGIGLMAAAHARSATVDLPETFLDRSWQRTRTLFANAEQRAALDARLYSVADVNYGSNLRVADWLRQNTEPEDKVFIWGFEPHIHVAAARRPASKYIYNVPQRVNWENQGPREQLMAELHRKPPKVILVEHGDVFSRVTGNHDDSARALRDFEELQELIDDRYSFWGRIGDLDLYIHR